jgi:hypothetical protein
MYVKMVNKYYVATTTKDTFDKVDYPRRWNKENVTSDWSTTIARYAADILLPGWLVWEYRQLIMQLVGDEAIKKISVYSTSSYDEWAWQLGKDFLKVIEKINFEVPKPSAKKVLASSEWKKIIKDLSDNSSFFQIKKEINPLLENNIIDMFSFEAGGPGEFLDAKIVYNDKRFALKVGFNDDCLDFNVIETFDMERLFSKDKVIRGGDGIPSLAEEFTKYGINPRSVRAIDEYMVKEGTYYNGWSALEQASETLKGKNLWAEANKLKVGTAAFVEFIFVNELILFFDKLVNPDSQGAWTTGFNHLYFAVPSASEVASFNATHDRKMKLNTVVTNIMKGPNQHKYVFDFVKGGPDSSHPVYLNAAVYSGPFYRGKNDPYFNEKNLNDALVNIEISDTSKFADTNKFADAQEQAMKETGISGFAQNLLPGPEYSLKSVRNTETGAVLFENGVVNKLGISSSKNSISQNGISGLFLNPNQEFKLSVQVPKSSGNSGEDLVSTGLVANFTLSEESGTTYVREIHNTLMASEIDKEATESATKDMVTPYLYSGYDCSFPTKIGDTCNLKLKVGGMNDGKKHRGHLYLAEGISRTTSIPVYLNYHLISEPNAISISENEPSTQVLQMMNSSSIDYSKVELSGLPSGAKIVSNSCSNGLGSGQQCQIGYDLSGVEVGDYQVKINGIVSGASGLVPEADSSDLKLTVTPNW